MVDVLIRVLIVNKTRLQYGHSQQAIHTSMSTTASPICSEDLGTYTDLSAQIKKDDDDDDDEEEEKIMKEEDDNSGFRIICSSLVSLLL